LRKPQSKTSKKAPMHSLLNKKTLYCS